MSEAAGGTSRRQFLGRTAGAAAVIAGAGVGAGAIAQSAAAADGRTYTGGRFALSVGGAMVGRMPGLDGGTLRNVVVSDRIGGDPIPKKHIGNLEWGDCIFQLGSGMSVATYQWIKDSFDRKDRAASNRASMVTVGSRGEEVFRRSFDHAIITEVTFPPLDLASTTGAQIAVTISSQDVTDRKPSGQPVVAAKQKAWMCSNFRLKIDGVDTRLVTKIDSFTWKVPIQADGSPGVDIDNLVLTCDISTAPQWQQWLSNLQQGLDDERSGTLQILGASLGGAVTLGFVNLGVCQVRPDHAPGQPNNGRIKVELYCEDIKFDYKSSWA
ncbi:MAG: hypothetical protein QOG85_1326 [Gaiellaceae bacterium]|nr:hypothetical protein [Gaiellaceae bacterium]